jgi:hypothetical protein
VIRNVIAKVIAIVAPPMPEKKVEILTAMRDATAEMNERLRERIEIERRRA